ncbi:MAG: hypothetical protein QN188_02080 [Armatimonadota bacterium]|nr:hypothetical protein [Armatimonadota bacterium]MDR5676650.1 hypothetical protein [Armatimonadota bacterium]MDR7386844.1 hypothetical protein [Armatimonadota bacterium]MDR7388664.1 hypothetical protein [Armatimonadota bacterium]MDR7397106.1 hypothetical protein [Armatimonadota bacterium]
MVPTGHRPLGEILLQARVISPQQLEQAVTFQLQHGIRLGEALVRLGFATEDDVAWALSTQLGLPYVHLRPDMVDPEALQLLPVDTQRRLGVLPLLAGQGELAVALADPTDHRVLAEVQRLTGMRPCAVVALASNIREVVDALAGAPPPARNGDLALRLVLSNAAQKGATHVYVEPLPGRAVRVRYRTPAGVFPADGPQVPWESLAALADRADPRGVLAFEVVLADRSVEAALRLVRTRWGAGLAGPLRPVPADPLQDEVGLPAEVWDSALQGLHAGGLLAVACPEAGLRARLLRSLAARVASRWGGIVVLAGAGGVRPVPAVVESPEADAPLWQQARPDALVADSTAPSVLRQLLLGWWPGQRLVLGLPGYRARHVHAALGAEVVVPVRGVLAAVPVPALCRCATVHHTPPAWPTPKVPARWASPGGCDSCRYTGFSDQAVAYEWDPAQGQGVPLEASARRLVEQLRAAPEFLVPVLEG